MKNNSFKAVIMLLGAVIFSSCLREDIVATPGIKSVKYYMNDAQGKDSLIGSPVKGKTVKIVVDTDADMCSVWPGGIREIMKKKISSDGGVTFADSIDMFNNPVLVKSDRYTDYGLIGARGLKTTLSSDGWYCNYTYPDAGDFNLVVVVTNHGYQDKQFKPAVIDFGMLSVK
ncbi:hypothetical protein [Dyadobacter tibetensis]|uniref:hypothetical protein n=1 Tax=Dyadobacter tibetensis TaxID=1211851 RepID=UPI000470C856|nr:hypothetical protein [Dyadobacter tibetensis]